MKLFYTGGTNGGSGNLKTLLQYLQHSTADNAMDESTRVLHDYILRVKTSPEVKEDYMRFEEFIAFEQKDVQRNTKIQDILYLLED